MSETEFINFLLWLKAYGEADVKAKDYDYIIGKYGGSLHQECDLNLSLTKKIHVVFHNFQNYDSHFIFQEIRN